MGFACFTCVGHCIATIFLYWDAVKAKERKARNKALLMQMHPQASLGFSSIGRRELYAGGSYATGGGSRGTTGGSGYMNITDLFITLNKNIKITKIYIVTTCISL